MHFLGRYRANLDAKHRVAVPARLRDRVDERERGRFILTVLPEDCLVLYPLSEWEHIEGQFSERVQSSLADPAGRELERELFSNAVEVACDRQGRILIPEEHRERAGLTKDVTFAGVRNRIEVWDTETWQAGKQRRSETFDRMAREILGPPGASGSRP